MKRIWSFLLALSLVLALPAAGFAADGATVGTSTVIGGVAEGGTLPCSKSVNRPEQQGFSWDMDSEKEPVSASYTLFGEQMEVRILNLVNENGLWLSGIRTYGMEKHTFSREDIGKVFSGSLTVNWKDGSSSEWKLEMTVTDDPNPNAAEKPYLVGGRQTSNDVPERDKIEQGESWKRELSFNYNGTNGYPFTLFSDKKLEKIEAALNGEALKTILEEQALENNEYRAVCWTGIENTFTKADIGKTVRIELKATWEDKTSSAFYIDITINDTPSWALSMSYQNGNSVGNYNLQLGETYTAKVCIIDESNWLGRHYAGQKMTVQWCAEAGFDRIRVPQTSFVPHDEKGTPIAYEYGEDPASYIIPEDTSNLGNLILPFEMNFTAEAVGDFDIRFETYIDGKRVRSSGFGQRIRGQQNIISSGVIENVFNEAEKGADVVIPMRNLALNSGSFETILTMAKENKTKKVSLEVTGANNQDKVLLTFDVSALDINSSQYQKFLKETNGIYDPSVNLQMPEKAREHGFSSGRWLDFTHSGPLPAPITVTVDVPEDVAGEDGSKLRLWYYNSVTGRADDTGTTVTVQSGKASFAIDHCSAYALYPVGYDPNPKASATGASGSSGSSGGIADLDWADARSELKAAKAGETVRLSLPTGERVPASLLRALAAKEDVTLVLQQGGKTLRIHSGDIGTLTKAEYRFSELQSLFGEAEGESSKPAAAGEKANPGTGAPVRM